MPSPYAISKASTSDKLCERDQTQPSKRYGNRQFRMFPEVFRVIFEANQKGICGPA